MVVSFCDTVHEKTECDLDDCLFIIVAAVGCIYAQGRKLRNVKQNVIRGSGERGKHKDASFLDFFCPDDSASAETCKIWGDKDR